MLVIFLPGAAVKNSPGAIAGNYNLLNVIVFTGTGTNAFAAAFNGAGFALATSTNTSAICTRLFAITSGATAPNYVFSGGAQNTVLPGPLSSFLQNNVA